MTVSVTGQRHHRSSRTMTPLPGSLPFSPGKGFPADHPPRDNGGSATTAAGSAGALKSLIPSGC
jgi:hypothetical protein